MINTVLSLLTPFADSALWSDKAPIRQELFGVERLEQHAETLAEAQPVTSRPPKVLPLQKRLTQNATVLLAAYRASATHLANGEKVAPAAEWLLDNYHLVEEQIREIRDDLPPGYYRQLPKLASGPFAGYPRVFGIAWAFVAHTDSHFDAKTLRRFICAYQRIQPLTIGELWAVAITLRIVLVENLRRLADQIIAGHKERTDADALADNLLAMGCSRSALVEDIASRSSRPLEEPFAAQLAKRLRDQDPRTMPALEWLEERLQAQSTTVEEVVQHAQLRQGASNLSIRNVITSMRQISSIDWSELFESMSLVDGRLRAHDNYPAMDFATRNLYRSAIEELSRRSRYSELEVTGITLQAAEEFVKEHPQEAERGGDPGYHLLAAGRQRLEQRIGYRPSPNTRFNRLSKRLGMTGYLSQILLLTLALLALATYALMSSGLEPAEHPYWYIVLGLLVLLPASEAAITLVNRLISWAFGPQTLPALELKQGIPPSLRTLVVIPTLLTDARTLDEQLERLEVHHLSGKGGDVSFALLSDGVDADRQILPEDAGLIEQARAGIAELNLRHGAGPTGDRFLLLHRHRRYNEREGKWMGWERKRGKLTELNQLLRGATDTGFMNINGVAPQVGVNIPADVRYVVTLDADTRLPRDTVAKLVGKMAHPLNHPQFNHVEQRVVSGYGILQPRVTPALPVGQDGSWFQRIHSGPAGMDPYAAAVSDVYQDLFDEGSFTGKGIYDVNAFDAALTGRVPENTLLSHDLFEGIFARAGLVSDIEVVEDFPTRYDVASQRQHRWTRGDWQLLPWLTGRIRPPGANPSSAPLTNLGRGKIADNLRRSLLPPLMFASLVACWWLPAPAAFTGTLLVIAASAIRIFLPLCFDLIPARSGVRLRSHLSNLNSDLRLGVVQLLASFAFLPDQAWRMMDAISRALIRMRFTRRNLLEWTTAAQSESRSRLSVPNYYRQMAPGTILGCAAAGTTVLLAPPGWPLACVFGLLWLGAPALALWASRPLPPPRHADLSAADAQALRLTARRTWRFFETFVTRADNMLPPDNFQEDPKPVVARRTSPTNMGLYLLSCVAARDFGWAGTHSALDRLEATLASMRGLKRYKGHFFNWYATEDARVLEPAYVSSVDSGNLAGHLIVVAQACEEWIPDACAPEARQGLLDTVQLGLDALSNPPSSGEDAVHRTGILKQIREALAQDGPWNSTLEAVKQLAAKANDLVATSTPVTADQRFWMTALQQAASEHLQDMLLTSAQRQTLNARLQALADQARALALGMDFTFLMSSERKLLSIGYSQADNSLDPSCYDLLASEARLASLFAIAKGDVSTQHWFRLGRAATPLGNGSALISWSGSMFEYLMPSLVMRAPSGSLLEQTNGLVVDRQQAYGESLGIPWGISESAYNARDMELTYQYSNFGVPGLGLKRGLAENVVIAPYATGLATMVDPAGALRNYERLEKLGALGTYGFYEALDFTRARLPENEQHAIVRNFMAHHQGMTIVAIANALKSGHMRSRFHREPIIQACELLLQERIPRTVAISHPRAEEVTTAPPGLSTDAVTTRQFSGETVTALQRPITHLLSNGRYAVMLTASGGGYSRWQEFAITRWREDATRDHWGSFIFLRDIHSNKVWAPTAQTVGAAMEDQAERVTVVFGEDHAEFTHREEHLTTTMEILVSGEDDGEVRRISLVNSGRRKREIELTSYAEVVLNTVASDNAHPAFSKMFVQTEYLPDFGALIATRRPRSQHEPQLWAAHFAVLEASQLAPPQYESDRARFFRDNDPPPGNGQKDRAVAAVAERPLSNTAGTVLDPIFSLRHRIKVAAGSVARIAFWTVVAPSRTELLDLIDKHHDRSAFDRAQTLAWTQAQVQLRHLAVGAEEAGDFQHLAAPILYADRRFRANSEQIAQGIGAQSGLWPQSISGDLPIVLLRIDDVEDMAQVRQMLRAHEYWRMKRLSVDLVIINERASSYIQDLQIAIETAVRSSQSRPRFGAELSVGNVYALRADLISSETRALLHAVARVILTARHGPLVIQLARLDALEQASRQSPLQAAPPQIRPHGVARKRTDVRAQTAATHTGSTRTARHEMFTQPDHSAPQAISRTLAALECFNGFGGFDRDGREYVTVLTARKRTPAPWINVISNPGFGFQVSAEGSGYTWADSSRENQLTSWSNDPVLDPPAEAIYVRDQISGELWSPTAQPINDGGTYTARHGFGYSRFEHQAHGIHTDLLQFVPLEDPVKISRLTLRNQSARPRQLSITSFTEWVLGTVRGASAPFIITEIDGANGALLARNPWSAAFSQRIAFADCEGKQTGWTADRTEFLGPLGSIERPVALLRNRRLSDTVGAGLDPCAVMQQTVELGIGESVEVVFLLGQGSSLDQVRQLVQRYRAADHDAELTRVTDYWKQVLQAIQVKTPDRTMDIMLNGWLLYQTLACRVTARSAFYQASGAYGFRDQLQDGMALTFIRPDATRSHLLRVASRQFPEGDVQHWWLPHSGQGVRTRISDDRVWLGYATATYINASGDAAVLDEPVPFLHGQSLRADEHDAFFQPMVSEETASLFEHCARGLDQSFAMRGALGLPLIGTGDWNDGMNRVGEGGQGESVWLAWLLVRTVDLFTPFAAARDPERAARWAAQRAEVVTALDLHCWDGDWYRRATFDDGSWLGSKDNDECRIDSIAQSWAVLSGAGDPERAARAMASVDKHLIRREEGLALLFTPPFDKTERDPGYIKGYPPGLRENGGQYSHAAMWLIFAFARLGRGDKAAELFRLLNPITHARDETQAERYKVEPYAVAADIYSVAPHNGRGGWTWYTGAAGWMHRAGMEGILGIRREGNALVIAPTIPAEWPGFEAQIALADTHYAVYVDNQLTSVAESSYRAELNGVNHPTTRDGVRVALDGGQHTLRLVMTQPEPKP